MQLAKIRDMSINKTSIILEIPRIRKYRSENQFSVFPNFVSFFLDRAKFFAGKGRLIEKYFPRILMDLSAARSRAIYLNGRGVK